MEVSVAPKVARKLQPEQVRSSETQNVFVIPDLNGKLAAFRRCLLAMDLIEPSTWKPTELGSAPSTHVVQLGDVVGMNQEALRIYDGILELRNGGMNIDALLGNHEVRMLAALQENNRKAPWHADKWLRTTDGMNICQEMIRISGEDELNQTKGLNPMKRLEFHIFDERGKYYELLGPEHAKVALQRSDTLVSHAAPDKPWLERFVAQGDDGMNAYFRSLMFTPEALEEVAHRESAHGDIVWQNKHEADMYSSSLMSAVRDRGVSHLVHGHIEQPEPSTIIQASNVKLHDIDCIGHRFGTSYAVFHSDSSSAACVKGEYAGKES